MDGSNMEARGPGKNKRMWSVMEDEKLIEALLDLQLSGTFKADNGFKSGYFAAVEKILDVTLPNSGIKADPHIKSRVRSLKTNFSIVYDMLFGPFTSGFGWNEVKQCVDAELAVWNEYLKSHKKAAPFKDKSFPQFNNLAIIFGKDRAAGKHAVGFGEAEEEIREEDNFQSEDEVEMNDSNVNLDGATSSMPCEASPGIESTTTGATKKKNKKRKRSDSNDALFLDIVEKSSQRLGSDIKEASETLSLAVEDTKMKELKSKINGELKKLTGLSMLDRHKATIKMGCDGDLTMQFFSIEDEEKEEWIQALLSMG